MEIDSMPEEMDKLDRRLIQLKIEREALKKESDEASKKRLADLEGQIGTLEREFSDLDEIWKSEKAAVQGTAHIKEELDRARVEMETARRAGDLTRMSELQYGRIPELEKRSPPPARSEGNENQLLRNKVTDEEVAQIVSKWTGIPVSKMLEGERDKLLRWRGGRAARGRPAEAVRAVSTPSAAPAPACRTRTGRSARSCSSAPPASARPSCARPWPSSCSTPKRPWSASTCPSSWRSTRWPG
jgi:ATP-dependent Clp protease ATP-binding subunit ClpB